MIAVCYQRRYNKLHWSIYGLSYDLYVLKIFGHIYSVYSSLNYLWSPLIKVQLSKRYPLFYPLNHGTGIPVSILLLIKDILIIISGVLVLRQLTVYRSTKHVHQSISKLCLLVLMTSAAFGISTYTFACSNLPENNSGRFGVFYVEHINYLWVTGNVLRAFQSVPQFSLNWIGMSTNGLSSKFVLITFLNKLILLVIRTFSLKDIEYYNVPFNLTPLLVVLSEFIFITGILYQAQYLYLGKKQHLPKRKRFLQPI